MLRNHPEINYTLWEARRLPGRVIMINRCATLVQMLMKVESSWV